MRINRKKMEEAGFVVANEGTDIVIYPDNGRNGMFEHFKDLMRDDGMAARDAEMLADEFAGQYTNRVIYNLFEV